MDSDHKAFLLMKYHIEETMRPVFPSTKAHDPTYNAKITTAGSKDPSVSMTRIFSPPPMTTKAVACLLYTSDAADD